jgi:predicted ATPase
MITGVAIENFKGIRERLEIAFAPITLFFGANSAGKSTVIDAMDFLFAILETQSPMPELHSDRWRTNFSRLVNENDLSKEVKIGITCELTSDDDGYFVIRGHAYPDDASLWSAPAAYSGLFSETPTPMSLEISLAHQPRLFIESIVNGVIVQKLRISYLQNLLVEIEPSPSRNRGLSAYLWRVNLDHELLAEHADRNGSLEFLCLSRDIFPNPSDPPLLDGLYEGIDGSEEIPNDTIANLLNSLVTAAFQIAKYRLKRSRRIGALRTIPDSTYLPKPSMDSSHWRNGIAAWDDLAYCGEDHLIDINSWLIRIGARCIVMQQKLVDLQELDRVGKLDRKSHQFLEWLMRVQTSSVRRVGLMRANNETEAAEFFWNPPTDRELLCPADFGTGISQLIPIVVACRDATPFFWSIMQPELHLHPRMQAELGDLFINSTNQFKHQFVIETHSENLLLRLLRRIRESHKNTQPNGLKIRTDGVAIYFFRQNDDQTLARKIDVDVNGDFIQPWPDDFFEIDFYERFA